MPFSYFDNILQNLPINNLVLKPKSTKEHFYLKKGFGFTVFNIFRLDFIQIMVNFLQKIRFQLYLCIVIVGLNVDHKLLFLFIVFL